MQHQRYACLVSISYTMLNNTVHLQPPVSIPPHEDIIGYVTTGSFSLSLGEGSAIGSIPLAKLIDLKLQAQRYVFKNY